MKLLFLHLSDFHLTTIPKNIDRIICDSLLNPLEKSIRTADYVNVVFTGDLSQSGQEDQICAGSLFFESYLSQLRQINPKAKVRLYAVPGNHDLCWQTLERKEAVISSLPKDQKKKFFESDLKSMDCFFEWATNSCKLFTDGTRCSFSCLGEGECYYALINSAPLSGKDHNDKDSHILLESGLPTVNHCPNGYYSFLLMHHRPDWFEEESKDRIDEFIGNHISLAFFGHEHRPNQLCIADYNGEMKVSMGGTISFVENEVYGSFNALLLDTESGKLNSSCYVRDQSSRTEFTKTACKIDRLQRKNATRQLAPDFTQEHCTFKVASSENVTFDLDDIFVMPFVNRVNDPESESIDYESLLSIIGRKKNVILRGLPGIGKSILLSKLFRDISRRKLAVFIDLNSMAITNNPKKMIDDQIRACYMHDITSEFDDADPDNRYVFIDGKDERDINQKTQLWWEFIEEHFGHIVTVETKNESDLPMSTLKKDLSSSDETFYVYGISYSQRKEIIRKICTRMDVRDAEDVARVEKIVFNVMSASTLIDSYEIPYLVELTVKTIETRSYMDRAHPDDFRTVFVSDLINAIRKTISNAELDFALRTLSFLAHGIVIGDEHKTVFDENMFNSAFIKAVEYEGKTEYTPRKLLKDLLDTNIIMATIADSEYRFTKNSFLAYFAADGYIVEASEKGPSVYTSLAQNIGYGLNGDILLFILYAKKDLGPIIDLRKALDESLKHLEVLNFDEPNNEILRKGNSFPTKSILEIEAERDRTARIDKTERKRRKVAFKNESNALKESQDKQMALLDKWITSVFVISKACATSIVGLTLQKRVDLLAFAISSLFKVFYALFGIDAKTMEEIEKGFTISKSRKEAEGTLSDDLASLTAADLLFDYLNTVVLNVVTSLAMNTVSMTVDKCIAELPDETFPIRLFKFTYFERKGDFALFARYLRETPQTSLNVVEWYMVRRICLLFMSTSRLESSNRAQITKVINEKAPSPSLKKKTHTQKKKKKRPAYTPVKKGS